MTSEAPDLAARWRRRAEDVGRYAPPAAVAFLEAADDFERWLRGRTLEPLSLREAAIESGYSPRHLRRMIREGVLPNAGTSEEPLILRRDLPRKPGYRCRTETLADATPGRASSRAQVARAIAAGE